MLDNSLTLSVDVAHDSNLVDITYTRFDELLNRSVYNSENHNDLKRDTLGFYRTLPKKSGNSRGVKKSAFKLTQDQDVPGVDATTTLVAPAIFDVSSSLPVGTSPAVVMEMRQRLVALINSDVFIKRLMEDLEY